MSVRRRSLSTIAPTLPARALAASILASTAIGCGAGGDTVDPSAAETIESDGLAINDSVLYPDSSCDATQKANISAAMAKAWNLLTVNQFTLKECLKEAVLSPDFGSSPEQIVNDMLEDLPTKMYCADDPCGYTWAGACAPIGVDYEKITWERSYATAGDIDSMAGTLLHEVAHNKGYDHVKGQEYASSVNAQLDACAELGDANGPKRSSIARETELAQAGADGGQPFALSCPSGSFMAGATAGTSNVVRHIAMTCANITTGLTTSTLSAGSAAQATTFTGKSCGPNGVLTGVWGRAGTLIDQMAVVCTKLADVKASITGGVLTSLGGGAGGTSFRRSCPAGMAVKHIYGRAGAAIDQVRVVCQDVNEPERGTFGKMAVLGSQTGHHDEQRCMGFGAMVALHGRAGSVVDRIGGVCQPLVPYWQTGQLVRMGASEHITPANGGGYGGTEFVDDKCPGDMALIGAYVRSDTGVDRVAGICARMSKWKLGLALVEGDKAVLAGHGGAGGDFSVQECPQGEWLAGIETWSPDNGLSAASLNGMRLVCRKLAP